MQQSLPPVCQLIDYTRGVDAYSPTELAVEIAIEFGAKWVDTPTRQILYGEKDRFVSATRSGNDILVLSGCPYRPDDPSSVERNLYPEIPENGKFLYTVYLQCELSRDATKPVTVFDMVTANSEKRARAWLKTRRMLKLMEAAQPKGT